MDILGGLGSVIGSWISSSAQKDIASQNIENQKLFAQNGIQWKVADAQKAGIHPLVGLGAQTQSFSPVSVGDSGWSDSLGKLGQDITRAMKANSDEATREQIDNATARKLDLEKKTLENDVLRAELNGMVNRASRAASQLGPAMPAGAAAGVPIPRPGPARSADGLALNEDEMKQKPGDAPAQVYSRPFGYYLEHNPWFSDGQVAEDRYGDSEILSTMKAAANLGADHVYTGYKYWLPSFPAGSGYRVKRFRRGNYTAPSYRPWAE